MTARAGQLSKRPKPAAAAGPSLAADDLLGPDDLSRLLASALPHEAAARCLAALVALFGEPMARRALRDVLSHKPMAPGKARGVALRVAGETLKAGGVRDHTKLAAKLITKDPGADEATATTTARRRLNRARKQAADNLKG